MDTDFKEIAQSALKLSEEKRAELATQLLASLGDRVDDEVEQAWAEELKRRIEEVELGEVGTFTSDKVLRRAREKLKRRN